LVDGERFCADGGADDIDEGVDGSDFVEVDLVDGAVVDFGFGGSESFEDADCGGFGGARDVGGGDDGADFGEAASVRMGVGVRGMMSAGAMLSLFPEDLAGKIFFSIGVNVDFGGGDAVAGDAGNFELGAEVEGGDGFFEKVGGDTGVEESAEKHVSADAGKAVEVGKAHGKTVVGRWSLVVGPWSLVLREVEERDASASTAKNDVLVARPPQIDPCLRTTNEHRLNDRVSS
jgi:hypothetical protein